MAKQRILLAEGDREVREILEEHLKRCGYEVISVASGADAWSSIESLGENIDLLLADVDMPEPNGAELGAMVSEKYEIRTIYMSGDYESTRRLSENPGNIVLDKHVKLNILDDTIRKYFDAA